MFEEIRRAHFERDDLVFKVFKDCLNTANNVQGPVNTYYRSSVFEEKRRTNFQTDDLVFKVFKVCSNTGTVFKEL